MEKSKILEHSHSKEGLSIDKEYCDINHSQIEEHNSRKEHQDDVDEILAKMNLHTDVLYSSPAFLGRNPINHDRKRQLAYLNRGLEHTDAHSLSPNPPEQRHTQFEAHRQVAVAKELPAL
jgi:hypothetical protein